MQNGPTKSIIALSATCLVVFSLALPVTGAQPELDPDWKHSNAYDVVLVRNPFAHSGDAVHRYLMDRGVLDVADYETFALAAPTREQRVALESGPFEITELAGRTITGRGGYFFDTRVGEPRVPDNLRVDSADPAYAMYIVQFVGPIRGQWVQDLGGLGVEVYDYLPQFSYIAQLSPSALPRVRELPYIQWIGVYQPAFKLSPAFSKSTNGSVLAILSLIRGRNPERVAERVSASGGTINEVWKSLDSWSLSMRVPRTLLPQLARLPEVAWIEPSSTAAVANVDATWVVQTNQMSSYRVHSMGLKGQNQVITMADTGIDICHEAFRQNALQCGIANPNHRKVYDYYVPVGSACGDLQDAYGHGTHIAGTIAGDAPAGDGSYGTYNWYDGHAFLGQLIVQDISSSAFGALCPPDDLYNLYWPSFNAGSRIHSDSWGGGLDTYCDHARQTDSFMWEHSDFLVLFAAGNEGPGASTLLCEANAKNIVTVGGTRNVLWANNMYCDVPLGDCSSRGPAGDLRLKPTVLAPGTGAPGGFIGVVSALSSKANPNWCDGQVGVYTPCSGTSMATAATAGSAALVRQYFLEGWYPSGIAVASDGFTPSAALIKATLINSATEITGTGFDDNGWNFYPNNNQGWGRILLDGTLYFAGDQRQLMVVDQAGGLPAGVSKTFQVVVVDGSQPFETTLVWTDYPGAVGALSELESNLDLLVTDPAGNQYRGNVFSGSNPGQSTTGGTYDSRNIEESVLRLVPAAGTWTITVTATNVPNNPTAQGFALVTTARMQLSADAEPESQQVVNILFTGCHPPYLGLGGAAFTGNAYGGVTPPAYSYLWTFPSGSPSSSTVRNPPQVEWSATGTYTISFKVTDGAGSQSIDYVTVQVVQHSNPGCPF